MLIHSAAQLLILKGGPQRGHALGTLGIIENGAVVVRDEKIVAVGETEDLRNFYPNEPTIDASGSVVMPGFVDPHTHLVWAGDRADEFKNLGGASLAAELDAASADHLVCTSEADIPTLTKSETVAVSLHPVRFGRKILYARPQIYQSQCLLRPGQRLQPRHELE